MKGDALSFLEPSTGVARGTISDFIEMKPGGDWNVRMKVEENTDLANASLDLTKVGLYSSTRTLIPTLLAAHVNDPHLPSAIVKVLSSVLYEPKSVSFARASSEDKDFILVAHTGKVRPKLEKTTALYAFSFHPTASSFARFAYDLIDALREWGKRYDTDIMTRIRAPYVEEVSSR